MGRKRSWGYRKRTICKERGRKKDAARECGLRDRGELVFLRIEKGGKKKKRPGLGAEGDENQ